MLPPTLLKRIRLLLLLFIVGLVISGATAIPLETELKLLVQIAGADGNAEHSGFAAWLLKVRDALVASEAPSLWCFGLLENHGVTSDD